MAESVVYIEMEMQPVNDQGEDLEPGIYVCPDVFQGPQLVDGVVEYAVERAAHGMPYCVDLVALPPVVTADFSGAPLSGDAPLTVSFTDLSVAERCEIVAWLWDFGDGGTSPDQHPDHQYADPGDYTISLTVTADSDVSDQRTQDAYVHVDEATCWWDDSLDYSSFDADKWTPDTTIDTSHNASENAIEVAGIMFQELRIACKAAVIGDFDAEVELYGGYYQDSPGRNHWTAFEAISDSGYYAVATYFGYDTEGQLVSAIGPAYFNEISTTHVTPGWCRSRIVRTGSKLEYYVNDTLIADYTGDGVADIDTVQLMGDCYSGETILFRNFKFNSGCPEQ